MAELKLVASKATVKLLDNCVELFSKGPFDAINVPILLNALVDCDKAFLREYLEDQGSTDEDFDALMETYMVDRSMELVIADGEKFDGLTQEEAAMIMPFSHVPDDEMEDEEAKTAEEFFDELDDELEEMEDDSEEESEEEEDLEAETEVEAESDAENADEEAETEEDDEDEDFDLNDVNGKIPLTQVVEELKQQGDGTQYILMSVKNKGVTSLEILDTDPRKSPETKKETSSEPKKTFKSGFRSENAMNCVLTDTKGKEHWYPSSNEFLKLLVDEIPKMAMEYNFTEIEPVHFTIALFRTDNPLMKEMMSDFEVSYRLAKAFFTSKSVLKVGIIPMDLQSFVWCLNDNINATKPCEILMRDKEVQTVWSICLKMTKRNTIIVGEPGVGKSALIEKMAYDIVTGNCPERFKNYQILCLDVNSLIAGTEYRGQAEERIKELIDFLKSHDNVILFIDEVHTILGAGACRDGEMDLANAMKPILARGDTVVIGATTNEEYEDYFAKDRALSRRFEKVEVKEPSSDKVYPMIKNKIKSLCEFHGVSISKNLVDYAVMISHCFNSHMKNPDRTLDVIDRSLVHASLKGKKKVTKDDILATYGIYFEMFEGMSKEAKMETAYHEMGHYVYTKLSPNLTDLRLLAVSIMPAKGYLGLTCHEPREDVVPHTNKAYYLDILAHYMAGRVSEKMYTSDITNGAKQDLEYATEFAHDMVSQWGMTADGEARNFVYLNTRDNPMFSEEAVNSLNKEVKAITDEAYKKAEEVIYANRDLIEALVEAIMEKHIMSENQLDEICQKFLKK
ncbi:MAG: AAA family ATPase [Clostridia bacterium]|nr:AAA family ATPase [Clostridia bacterium]